MKQIFVSFIFIFLCSAFPRAFATSSCAYWLLGGTEQTGYSLHENSRPIDLDSSRSSIGVVPAKESKPLKVEQYGDGFRVEQFEHTAVLRDKAGFLLTSQEHAKPIVTSGFVHNEDANAPIYFFSLSNNGELKIYRDRKEYSATLHAGSSDYKFAGHAGEITAALYLKDRDLLLVGFENGSAYALQIKNQRFEKVLRSSTTDSPPVQRFEVSPTSGEIRVIDRQASSANLKDFSSTQIRSIHFRTPSDAGATEGKVIQFPDGSFAAYTSEHKVYFFNFDGTPNGFISTSLETNNSSRDNTPIQLSVPSGLVRHS